MSDEPDDLAAGSRSLAGLLLIAAPSLIDPNFRRTVVLVLEHRAAGAVGVVLNRPSEVDASASLPALDGVLPPGERLHVGGPVGADSVIALGAYRENVPVMAPIVDNVGILSAELGSDDLDDLVHRARIYVGHAGWGPGQLEAELEDEAWYTEPAQPDDVFAEPDLDLWRGVLERKGGSYRLVARMPEDPSLN